MVTSPTKSAETLLLRPESLGPSYLSFRAVSWSPAGKKQPVTCYRVLYISHNIYLQLQKTALSCPLRFMWGFAGFFFPPSIFLLVSLYSFQNS